MTSKLKMTGLFFLVIFISASTSAVTHFLLWQNTKTSLIVSNPLAGFSTTPQQTVPLLVDCADKIYSPVQNKCVSQTVFDQEIVRLYSALGIDVSVLQLNGDNK